MRAASTRESYAITVTRGLLDQLNSDEIEAVLAHELTPHHRPGLPPSDRHHRVSGMLSFLAPNVVARSQDCIVQPRPFARRRRGHRHDDRRRDRARYRLCAGIDAALSPFASPRTPGRCRLGGYHQESRCADQRPAQDFEERRRCRMCRARCAKMFIENPPSAFDFGGLFATHPPIAQRIRVLEELGGRVPDAANPIAAPSTEPVKSPAMPPGTKSPWS